MSIDKDDRTEQERETHTLLVGGTDRVLSGWGGANNRPSYAFWACIPEDYDRVERWILGRGDLKRVRTVGRDYRGSSSAHVHVYVVREGHPALEATTFAG